MIEPVIGWFKVMQYDGERVILIANLVETISLNIYPKPM